VHEGLQRFQLQQPLPVMWMEGEPKRRLDAVTQRLIIQKTRENKTHEGAKHGQNTE